MLISAEHLSINFGSRQLLDDVDFYLNEGDITGVIGINGTGKSTFLKVLAGWLQPDSGTIARKPNLQVSVLAQHPDMHDDLTVLEQLFARLRELDPEADTIIQLWKDHPEGISDRAIARELGRPQKTFADQMKKYRTDLRRITGDK